MYLTDHVKENPIRTPQDPQLFSQGKPEIGTDLVFVSAWVREGVDHQIAHC